MSTTSIRLTHHNDTNDNDDETNSRRTSSISRSKAARKDPMYVELEDSTGDEGEISGSNHIPSSPTGSGSGLSDGDPPEYAKPFESSVGASTSTSVSWSGPPPAPTAMTTTTTRAGASRPSGPVPDYDQDPSSDEGGPPRREYDELEEIIFATPGSFTTMAFAIAENRKMKMLIADDRTYKITSAYMHIACVYRKSGCPFMLKLTKAKEGGWIMKTPKSTDVDLKQRSNYRCRHAVGSIAEEVNELGYPLSKPEPKVPGERRKEPVGARGPGGSASGGGSSKKRSGGRRESGVVKKEKLDDDVEGKLMPSRPARSRISMGGVAPAPASDAANHSPGAPSKTVVSREGEDLPRVVYLNAPSADRALAPPFERSVSLHSQISPVLQQGQYEVGPDGRPFIMEGARPTYYAQPTSIVGGRISFPQAPANPTHYQQIQQLQQQQQQLLQQQSLLAPHYRGGVLPLAVVPVVEPPSASLPQWTTFLTLLDPELITLAKTLASPSLDVNPESFFREEEEMRIALLDSLDMPTWPKLKLKNKIKAKGLEVWKVMEGMEVEKRIKKERASVGATSSGAEDTPMVDAGESESSKNNGQSLRKPSSPLVSNSPILPKPTLSFAPPAPRSSLGSSIKSNNNGNGNGNRQHSIPLSHHPSPPVLAPLVLEPLVSDIKHYSNNKESSSSKDSRSPEVAMDMEESAEEEEEEEDDDDDDLMITPMTRAVTPPGQRH